MTITIRIPLALRAYARGASEITATASTVRSALAGLEREHPLVYRGVCDETGAVRRHVNVFVNADHVRDLAGLDTALAPGDVLTIMPAVSGG
jgi:molybdopterin converting factor small subunit